MIVYKYIKGWSKDPGPPFGGDIPRYLFSQRRFIHLTKNLSVFIDESGDFGEYSSASPYYMVGMVFHDQRIDISKDIATLDRHIRELGFPPHAVHMGPLIRRESIYIRYSDESKRANLINAMYHFTRKLDIHYLCPYVCKANSHDSIELYGKLSREISFQLIEHMDFLNSYDKIIIYYDNGQHELTKVITSVFNTLFKTVELRKVIPTDYKLFQVADLICTWELLALKANTGSFSASERRFFISPSAFLKNRYKLIAKKKLP